MFVCGQELVALVVILSCHHKKPLLGHQMYCTLVPTQGTEVENLLFKKLMCPDLFFLLLVGLYPYEFHFKPRLRSAEAVE